MRTQAPLCFVFFCGCGLCVNVFLVQLLHDVWNFNLVSPLGPSTRQHAASLHSLFCKAFCFGMSVSATQFRRTQAPLCFVFFCGCGLCVNVFLVQLLHDVRNFNLVFPLGPFTRQNAASLHSLFCKAFCFGMSVSAIRFTSYLFFAHATTRLSTGTPVCRR